MTRPRSAVLVLTGICGLLLAAVSLPWQPAESAEAPPPRYLPGVQPGGEIRLPNLWSLRPAGTNLLLGDFPVNLALHPSGDYLAALHAGYGEHEIIIVDLKSARQHVVSRVTLPQTFCGLCFSPDGKTLYASGAEYEIIHTYSFDKGLLSKQRFIRVSPERVKFVVAGIAVDSDHQNLFAAGPWGDSVRIIPLIDPEKRRTVLLENESYPYVCLPEPGGKRLFVSLWGKSAVAVVDLAETKVSAVWPTESHPTEMALSPDGRTLYVACANSTRVSVLDVANNGKARETILCALYPGAPAGNTPSSLCLTPDGKMLFVANADSNNLAVINVEKTGESKPLGFIPVGWYPTSVRCNPTNKRIYVANGKGLGSKANPQGPGPFNRRGLPIYQYIASLMQGSLSTIDLPDPEKLAEHTRNAYRCSPLRRDFGPTAERPKDNPIPKPGESSPIKHCIYVIKENRTYDQVLGDVKEGKGEASLCLFGEKVTPNQHKLAREFVLLDNFYVEGEVSADGHQWSMGAYANDFVEKVWPLNYRGSTPLGKLKKYPSEGHYGAIERPAGGYVWDRCAEAGVSYRSYGEWIENGKKPGDPGEASVKALEGHFDPLFRGYDLDYPDVKRAERFLTELARFEREGELPRMIILRLPNDHTAGTRVGKPTPTAMVADNDLALGMVVEGVSKSKFWKDTAIFVLEDDAQNGPDHVDCHRSIAFVVSPYTRRKVVDSTAYTTSSMLRTMELILGLKPMSQFDAAATPMYSSFTSKADFTPYEHVQAQVDLKETNKASAFGAKESEKLDLDKEDAADDLVFNEIIWRSVKGPNSPMPAPVRAAFWVPKVKGK